jgi:8-oxo-dGTP pyrophosphatase MutT (NUDIX family)
LAPALQVMMTRLYNKIAQLFLKLTYKSLLLLWSFTKPTVHGVFIAIWHKEKLLVIKNSYRKSFTIPCGRLKRNEHIADAAARELYEEVGLRVDKHQMKFIGEYSANYSNIKDIGNFFEIEMAELPKIQIDNREVVWSQFMPLDQVAALNLNPTVRVWLDHIIPKAD